MSQQHVLPTPIWNIQKSLWPRQLRKCPTTPISLLFCPTFSSDAFISVLSSLVFSGSLCLWADRMFELRCEPGVSVRRNLHTGHQTVSSGSGEGHSHCSWQVISVISRVLRRCTMSSVWTRWNAKTDLSRTFRANSLKLLAWCVTHSHSQQWDPLFVSWLLWGALRPVWT